MRLGDGAPALMQMMEKGEDRFSGLARALGLPAKRTNIGCRAIRAADTDRTPEPGPSADVAGMSPVPVPMW